VSVPQLKVGERLLTETPYPRLLFSASTLADQFDKRKDNGNPFKRLRREELELICFEYVTGCTNWKLIERSIRLLTDPSWHTISALAHRARSGEVAVAYFRQGPVGNY
jgi:hypothetical protein